MFKYFVVSIPPAIASNIFDRLKSSQPFTVSAESVSFTTGPKFECVPAVLNFRNLNFSSNFASRGMEATDRAGEEERVCVFLYL